MKKMIVSYLFVLLALLLSGCAVGPFDRELVTASVGGINVSLETDESSLESRYTVISASFKMTDPLGGVQTTNWTVTPGTNHTFSFKSTIPGMHYLELRDIDSFGDTNVFTTNVILTSGNNYKFLLTLGADVKYFGIYTETLPMGITLGLDAALDWWSGGENLTVTSATYAEGTNSYRIAPVTAGWWGIGIRPNPDTAYRNMKTYTEGSLRFYFRGTKPVKVGVKFGSANEKWMTPPAIFNYGLKTNDTWCAVVIPFTNLAPATSFTNVSQFFMISADTTATYGYVPGSTIYYVDNIHWCNKTN